MAARSLCQWFQCFPPCTLFVSENQNVVPKCSLRICLNFTIGDLSSGINHTCRSRGSRGIIPPICTSGDNLPTFRLIYVHKLFDNITQKNHLEDLKCRKNVGRPGLPWPLLGEFTLLPDRLSMNSIPILASGCSPLGLANPSGIIPQLSRTLRRHWHQCISNTEGHSVQALTGEPGWQTFLILKTVIAVYLHHIKRKECYFAYSRVIYWGAHTSRSISRCWRLWDEVPVGAGAKPQW